jgi:hypothetical protein
MRQKSGQFKKVTNFQATVLAQTPQPFPAEHGLMSVRLAPRESFLSHDTFV